MVFDFVQERILENYTVAMVFMVSDVSEVLCFTHSLILKDINC